MGENSSIETSPSRIPRLASKDKLPPITPLSRMGSAVNSLVKRTSSTLESPINDLLNSPAMSSDVGHAIIDHNHSLQARMSVLELEREVLLQELQQYQLKLSEVDLLQKQTEEINSKVENDAVFYQETVVALKNELRKYSGSQSESEALQTKIDELLQSRQLLETSLKLTNKDMKRILNQNQSLSKTVQDLHAQTAKFIEINKRMKAVHEKQNAENQEKLRVLEEEKAQLQKKIQLSTTSNNPQVSELKRSVSLLQQEITETSKQSSDLKAENEKLRAVLENLEESLTKLEQEKQILEVKLLEKDEELHHTMSISGSSDNLLSKIKELETELEKKNSVLASLSNLNEHSENVEKVNKDTEFRQKISLIKQQYETQLHNTRRTLENLENTRKDTEERMKKLSEKLGIMNTERETLTNELVAANQARSQTTIENKRLRSELEQAAIDKNSFQNKVIEYKRLIDTIMNRDVSVKEKFEAVVSRVEELTDEKAKLELRKSELERDMMNLKEENLKQQPVPASVQNIELEEKERQIIVLNLEVKRITELLDAEVKKNEQLSTRSAIPNSSSSQPSEYLREQVDILSQKLLTYQNTMSQQAEQIDELKVQVKSYQEQTSKLKAEKLDYIMQLSKNEEQYQNSRKSNNDLFEVNSLKDQVKKYEEELKVIKDELKQAQESSKTPEQNVSSGLSAEEKEKLVSENAALTQKVQKLETSINELQSEKQILSMKIETSDNQVATLTKKSKDQATALVNLIKEKEELTFKMNKMRETVVQSVAGSQFQEAGEMVNKIIDLETSLKERNFVVEKLQTRIQDLETTLKQKGENLVQAEKDITGLKELVQVQKSKEEEFTKMLRRFSVSSTKSSEQGNTEIDIQKSLQDAIASKEKYKSQIKQLMAAMDETKKNKDAIFAQIEDLKGQARRATEDKDDALRRYSDAKKEIQRLKLEEVRLSTKLEQSNDQFIESQKTIINLEQIVQDISTEKRVAFETIETMQQVVGSIVSSISKLSKNNDPSLEAATKDIDKMKTLPKKIEEIVSDVALTQSELQDKMKQAKKSDEDLDLRVSTLTKKEKKWKEQYKALKEESDILFEALESSQGVNVNLMMKVSDLRAALAYVNKQRLELLEYKERVDAEIVGQFEDNQTELKSKEKYEATKQAYQKVKGELKEKNEIIANKEKEIKRISEEIQSNFQHLCKNIIRVISSKKKKNGEVLELAGSEIISRLRDGAASLTEAMNLERKKTQAKLDELRSKQVEGDAESELRNQEVEELENEINAMNIKLIAYEGLLSEIKQSACLDVPQAELEKSRSSFLESDAAMKLQELKNKNEAYKHQLETISQEKNSLDKALLGSNSAKEVYKKQVEQSREVINTLKEQIESLTREQERLKQLIRELEDVKSMYQTQIEQFKQTIQETSNQREILESKLQKYINASGAADHIKQAEQLSVQIENYETKLRNMQREYSSVMAERDDMRALLQDSKSKQQEMKKRVEYLSSTLENMNSNTDNNRLKPELNIDTRLPRIHTRDSPDTAINSAPYLGEKMVLSCVWTD